MAQMQRDSAAAEAAAGRKALEVLPELVAALKKPQGMNLVDNKGVGKPFEWKGGGEMEFRRWARKVAAYCAGAYGKPFRQVLDWAVEQDSQITKEDLQDQWIELASTEEEKRPRIEEEDDQLHTLLDQITAEESNEIVESAAEMGLEAWRLLHRRWDPTSGGRRQQLLAQIMRPDRCKSYAELRKKWREWERNVVRYERSKDSKGNRGSIDNDLKVAALRALMTKELLKHTTLNRSKLSDYDKLKDELEEILELELDDKHGRDAMDVDGFGKGGGDRAPWFDGECHRCGKRGHRERDCRRKPGEDKGKGKGKEGKGKGGKDGKGKGGKGKGGKGKGKGNGKGKGMGKGAYGLGCNNQWNDEAWQNNAWQGSEWQWPTEEAAGGAAANNFEFNSLERPGIGELRKENAGGWQKFVYDSGCAAIALPRSFHPEKDPKVVTEGAYKTANGELVDDYGPVSVKGYDAQGAMRTMKGTCTDVHKPLVGAAPMAQAGWQGYIWKGAGVLMKEDGELARQIEKVFNKYVKDYGWHQLIPLTEEDQVYNFWLQVQKTESVAALNQSGSTSQGAGSSALEDHWTKGGQWQPPKA